MLLFIILIVFGLHIYNSFAYGYVTSVFYGWFILPMFPNLPHFSYIQFVGITLFLIGLLPKQSSSNIKSEYTDNSLLFGSIFSPWLILIMGAIIHSIWF